MKIRLPMPMLSHFLVLALPLLVHPVASAEKAEPPANRPNILFIAIDDLRPELGCYGVEEVKSPHIDRLAARGMVFKRAYCQQAVCLPSRASLITGARPDTTKAWDLSTHFRTAMPDVVTLPQLFKNHGYFTQGMGKICHHGYDDPPSWSVPTTYPKAPHGSGKRKQNPNGPKVELSAKGRGPVVEIVDGPDNSLHDGELGDIAVAAIRRMKDKKEPFFLAVGFIKPHLPFNVPRKYWELYDPEKIPLAPNPFYPKGAPPFAIPPGGELRSYSGVPAGWPIKDDFARKLKHGYYAAISYVDVQVGRMLDELDRQGLSENTIVVIWGDHGWKLGEHQAWAKHTNVENDTRSPLILSAPGVGIRGATTEALVEFVDIYPSLAELAGLPLPPHLEGTSFKPLLDDPDRTWKNAAFSQFPRGKNMMGYTMRTDRYRYTKWVNRKDHSKVSATELYDHQADPRENINIAGAPENKEIIAKLDAQWQAGWKAALPR
jgi:iduronate 2-sulfatase